MNFLRKYFLHSPVLYVIAFAINSFLVLLVLFLRGFEQRIFYVDAFSVAGSISVFLGLLLWVASAGAFTTFGYAFSTFRSERKYKDLYEYTTAKKEKNAKHEKTYMPFIVIGLLFLAISFVILKIGK